MRPLNVLFLCTGNSTRSILVEKPEHSALRRQLEAIGKQGLELGAK